MEDVQSCSPECIHLLKIVDLEIRGNNDDGWIQLYDGLHILRSHPTVRGCELQIGVGGQCLCLSDIHERLSHVVGLVIHIDHHTFIGQSEVCYPPEGILTNGYDSIIEIVHGNYFHSCKILLASGIVPSVITCNRNGSSDNSYDCHDCHRNDHITIHDVSDGDCVNNIFSELVTLKSYDEKYRNNRII